MEKEKKKKRGEGQWTAKVEIRTRKKFLAVGEACVAIYSDLHQSLKGEHLFALGSQQKGNLIPVFFLTCLYVWILFQSASGHLFSLRFLCVCAWLVKQTVVCVTPGRMLV